MKKNKTPAENYIEKQINILSQSAKMDKELNKYGTKTPSGGMMWTVGDMQRFFLDQKKRRKK